MNSCNWNVFAGRQCVLRVSAGLVAISFLLITLICLSLDLRADEISVTERYKFPVINISYADERYTLLAEQAKLADVLLELGKAADFKFKTFDKLDNELSSWDFDSMPLAQLLTNLLRGHSIVMLYEESQDKKLESGNRKLKELWLIASENNSELAESSIVNIEIQLEQSEASSNEHQSLTLEQQREVSYIDNLEGLTSDDVIETLKYTLMSDKDPIIRKRAVIALSDIGGARVLAALESGLADRSGEVRVELAKSFAGIKHQSSMLALGQLLMGDNDVRVRQEAVRALYQQDSPAARSFVEAAQNDKEDSVKKVAKEILQQWALTPSND